LIAGSGRAPGSRVIVVRCSSSWREVAANQAFAAGDPRRSAQRTHDLADTGGPLLAAVAENVAVIDHPAQFANGFELFIAGIEAEIGQAGLSEIQLRRPPSTGLGARKNILLGLVTARLGP
jgi:hypothetical protein